MSVDGIFKNFEKSWDDVLRWELNIIMCWFWCNIFDEVLMGGGIVF